jgi:hypothetical protein
MQGLSALSAQAAISDSKQESTGRSVICIFYFLEIKIELFILKPEEKRSRRKAVYRGCTTGGIQQQESRSERIDPF